MKWEDFRESWIDAKDTFDRVDSIAATMGQMLVGRLRRCNWSTLDAFKRELRDFNMQTGKWKS